MRKKIFSLVATLVLLLCLTACGANDDYVKINWDDIVLGDEIPEPKSNKANILLNDEEHLSIYMADTSEIQFASYVEKCKKEGYTIDEESFGTSFYAYNEEGYYLSLYYAESEEEMLIGLDAPEKMGAYEIPSYAVEAGLPMPKSQDGSFNWKYDDNFSLVVGNTSEDDYEAYKQGCIDAGFSVDSEEGNDFYNASNSEGYRLNLHYKGNNLMSIGFECPEGMSTTEVEENTEVEATTEVTTEATTTEAPEPEFVSEYEKAFVRDMSNYDLYFMFDEDTNTVVYFGTDDTYVMEGTYLGTFSSGIDINWVDAGYHETFTYSGSGDAILTDYNGFDWEYEKCDIETAQNVLDGLR